MDEKRTFGVEIECHSKVDRYEMANMIKTALHFSGYENHEVRATGYGHELDGSNFTRWVVKTDSSVHGTRAQYNRGFTHNIEVVSPVLKGKEGLKLMEIASNVVNKYATVSKTCGLHIHHGAKAKEVKVSINNWRKHEEHFFSMLPTSRRSNGFCRKYSSYSNMRWINNGESVRNWFKKTIVSSVGTMSARYAAMNIESFLLRSTLEFRLHSGTTEFKKIKNWIILTQAFVNKAALLKDEDRMDFDSFLNKLGVSETWKEGSTAWAIYQDLLLFNNGVTMDEMAGIFKSRIADGEYSSANPTGRVKTVLSAAIKRGIASKYDGKYFPNKCSNEMTEAISWAKERRANFA
jgi:hypothetical protein